MSPQVIDSDRQRSGSSHTLQLQRIRTLHGEHVPGPSAGPAHKHRAQGVHVIVLRPTLTHTDSHVHTPCRYRRHAQGVVPFGATAARLGSDVAPARVLALAAAAAGASSRTSPSSTSSPLESDRPGMNTPPPALPAAPEGTMRSVSNEFYGRENALADRSAVKVRCV